MPLDNSTYLPTSIEVKEKKSNIALLADFIESHIEFGFNMSNSDNPRCGTSACIGGFGLALWSKKTTPMGISMEPIRPIIGDKLGLNYGEVTDLCFHPVAKTSHLVPDMHIISYESITRSMAVAALRRLDKTGEIYFDTSE